MYSAGEFYRAPPFCAAGCWYHSSLAEALPGCPVHSGEEGLGWHIWLELCLHRTQLCVSLRVKHWEVQRAGLCFQSENLPIDWLHGKILPSVSSQAVLRRVSSVHINQFVSRHVLLVKHTPVFNGMSSVFVTQVLDRLEIWYLEFQSFAFLRHPWFLCLRVVTNVIPDLLSPFLAVNEIKTILILNK